MSRELEKEVYKYDIHNASHDIRMGIQRITIFFHLLYGDKMCFDKIALVDRQLALMTSEANNLIRLINRINLDEFLVAKEEGEDED